MRKRRVLLFDDDPAVLDVLALFFGERGYDVVACSEPVACPIYHDEVHCGERHPCGDLMITDLEMPRMSGLELLELQARRGCKLTVRNKAVLSGNLNPASRAAVHRLGCAAFRRK